MLIGELMCKAVSELNVIAQEIKAMNDVKKEITMRLETLRAMYDAHGWDYNMDVEDGHNGTSVIKDQEGKVIAIDSTKAKVGDLFEAV